MNSRAPRVLQIGKYYPPHRGGMETHLEQLAGELNKSVDLEVLVSNDSRKTAAESVAGVKVLKDRQGLGARLNADLSADDSGDTERPG